MISKGCRSVWVHDLPLPFRMQLQEFRCAEGADIDAAVRSQQNLTITSTIFSSQCNFPDGAFTSLACVGGRQRRDPTASPVHDA
jgi:hypothetical protein